MWVNRSTYEYLKDKNKELIAELEKLKPLPEYNVFYFDNEAPVCKKIRGNLSYDTSFINFLDKNYHILAVIPTRRLISLVEIKK